MSSEELVKQRQSFKDGQLSIRIENDVFDMAKHNAFVDSIAAETATFKAIQQEAAAKQVCLRYLDPIQYDLNHCMLSSPLVVNGICIK